MYFIKQLNCLHAKTAREIFYSFFHMEEHSEFQFSWRVRERSRSVGIFTEEGDLLGYTLVWLNKLAYIVVDGDYQGMNLGSLLLTHILGITVSQKKTLHLTPVNAPRLIHWYKKHGFKEELQSESDTPGIVFRVLNFHSYNTRYHSKALSKYAK